jgi:MFS family permease
MVIFWYPAVLWAFLLFCATLTWIVVFSVVNATIFTAPPYNFSVSETGLISVSPFIMTFIGEVLSGPLNDWVCLWLARKNRGIYEPEFRLPTIIIPLIIGVVGFYGFGATIHYQTHWIGPVLCFGFANMSLAFANSCVFGYVIDAHKELAEEGKQNQRGYLLSGIIILMWFWYSLRRYKCSELPDIWADVLRQRLASTRRGTGCVQRPWQHICRSQPADHSALDIRKKDQRVYCPQ